MPQSQKIDQFASNLKILQPLHLHNRQHPQESIDVRISINLISNAAKLAFNSGLLSKIQTQLNFIQSYVIIAAPIQAY